MPHAVVLLLDQETEGEACAHSWAWRELTADEKGEFALDNVHALPHLSHLHLTLDDEGEELVVDEIDRIAASINAPTGRFEEIELINDEWLFWNTPCTRELYEHHEEVVYACARHRSGRLKVTWNMNPTQQDVWDRIGYPNALEAYEPHVTLQKLDKDKVRRAYRRPCFRSWRAESLALVKTGLFGSATRVIHQAVFRDVDFARAA